MRLHSTRKDSTLNATSHRSRKLSHGYCGWVIERTFAWLGRNRSLSKDYEALPESSEAWIYLAMIHLMLKRLHPK